MSAHSKPVRIVPSILSADFARLGEQLAEAERGGADAIHVDVMDGHFVPNITIGPLVVEAVRRSTALPLHVHLMIERPRSFVADFAAAGADVLIVHQENNWTLHRVLEEIRGAGASTGVAINPTTPVSHLEEIVPFVDLILVMTVEPGFGGQSFIPTMYDKVSRLRRYLDDRRLDRVSIEVDGGVNAKTIRGLVQAGADLLVAGAAVFAAHRPIGQAVAALRAAAEGQSPD
ncbi:MAG: ribulose-phosphate 3-epimerase [Anaerolineae bacterium]